MNAITSWSSTLLNISTSEKLVASPQKKKKKLVADQPVLLVLKQRNDRIGAMYVSFQGKIRSNFSPSS